MRIWTAFAVFALIAFSSARVVKIKKVFWGDSFVTEKGEMVRFLGIRAPLRGEPAGREAADSARAMLAGKQADLQFDSTGETRDETGATLAYVFLICDTCEGASLKSTVGRTNELSFQAPLININNRLLEKGYACLEPSRVCARTPYFKFLEKTAKNRKLGMWK